MHSVVGGAVEEVERTTPEAIDLQATFRRMVDAGDEACVMEVSSHALELHRADAIDFDCAVFTNLTQDHLDFHGTLEEYFARQARLFVLRATATPPRRRVVNVDDEWGRRLADELAAAGARRRGHVRRRRARPTSARASVALRARPGRRFVCTTREGTRRGAPAAARASSTSTTRSARSRPRARSASRSTRPPRRSRRAQRVPGRFEPVDEGQDFSVLVDYAHTPDSLENVLDAARELLEPERAADG